MAGEIDDFIRADTKEAKMKWFEKHRILFDKEFDDISLPTDAQLKTEAMNREQARRLAEATP